MDYQVNVYNEYDKEIPENVLTDVLEVDNVLEPDVIKKAFKYREERSVLVITLDGKILAHHWDKCEPEDNYFFRDYRWIETELMRAFELGQKSKEVVNNA